jgi:hypothetical protein
VEVGTTARLSHFREQREEAFSLGSPVCDGVLTVGVLDDRVWYTNGEYVFNEGAVGKGLSDIPVAGTGLRPTSGFQLNGNYTMTGVHQVVWSPGETIPVGDQQLSEVVPADVRVNHRARREPCLLATKVQPACECDRGKADQKKRHGLHTQVRLSRKTSTRNTKPNT